jgi:acetyltransferase-like isoleucine patch superfamily enzyme
MKELFVKKTDLSRKMWLLVVGLPALCIALGEVILYSPIPFNPTIPMIILWIVGMFFGTKTILGSDIQESKISLGKFVTIYTVVTIIFTYAMSIGARVIVRLMFGF